MNKLATALAIRCIAQITDCPSCQREPLRNGPDHVCDDLCDLQRANRDNERGHIRSHEPLRHECGAVLDDRQGNRYEVQRFCAWGTCVQYFCPGCRRFTSGWGPVGCQCEEQPCGHGTYDEYARPGAGRFQKKSKFASLLRRRR